MGDLIALREVALRYVAKKKSAGRLAMAPLRAPQDVYHWALGQRLHDEVQEHFVVLHLDGRHHPTSWHTASIGTLTASLVHPREVFAPALRQCAAAVILVHNHPSGDPTPSAEDRVVTTRLRSAGEVLGVRVLDHVVIGARGFVSLREDGGFEPEEVPGDGR